MLLLLEQVMVPVVLLPLCVHDRHRWRTEMAGSGSLSRKAKVKENRRKL